MSKREPPYGIIAESLLAGEAVPFLGAGVNYGSRPRDMPFDPNSPAFLPSGAELSAVLAKDSNFPAKAKHVRDDLARVSAFYTVAGGEWRLRQKLHQLFDRPYQPAPIHKLLAKLAARRPLLIVTTNYDAVMETALEAIGTPYDLAYYLTERKDMLAAVHWWPHGAAESAPLAPNSLSIDIRSRTVVYKMHGTVITDRRMPAAGAARIQRDSYVITEDDYVDFLARMADQKAIPSRFVREFRRRHFLFLGYGLGDWNLRVLLRSLHRVVSSGEPADDPPPEPAGDEHPEGEDIRSWAIQWRPPSEDEKLWEKRQVEIYDVDINTFALELARHLDEKKGTDEFTRAVQPPPGAPHEEPDYGD
jgi:hypothetical protein